MKFGGTSENLLRETKLFREISLTLSNNVDRFLFAKQTTNRTKPVWINWGYLKSVPWGSDLQTGNMKLTLGIFPVFMPFEKVIEGQYLTESTKRIVTTAQLSNFLHGTS